MMETLRLLATGENHWLPHRIFLPRNRPKSVPREQVLALLPRHMMEAEHAARVILDGVSRDQAVIVFPASVRWICRLYRVFLRLMDGAWLTLMRDFRKYRGAPDTR